MASAPGVFCSLCQEDNIDNPAVAWCTDCSNFLCNDCLKHHSRNKASKHHHTISSNDYIEFPDFIKNIKSRCQEHDQPFEVYCSLHESACCVMCVTTNHRKCPDLRKLSDVLKHVKSSASVEHTEEEMETLLKNYDEIQKHLHRQRESLKRQKTGHLKKISSIRQSINNNLDKLEKQFIQQINKEIQNLNGKYVNLDRDINNKRQAIQKMTDGHKKMKKYATDLQTFIGLDVISKWLQREVEFMRSCQTKEELHETNVNIQLSSILDSILALDRLGDISVSLSKDPVELEIIGTAQFPVPNASIDDIKPSLLKTFKLSEGDNKTCVTKKDRKTERGNKVNVTGCDLLPNGDFVIADQNVPYVKYYDNQGVLKKQINTESCEPFNVCFIDNNTIAVSTTPFSAHFEHILVVSTTDNKVIKKVHVGDGYKMLHFNKMLVVGSNAESISEIILINLEGKIINRFKTNDIGGVFMSNKLIFCTEWKLGHDAMVCYDVSGNINWKYQDPSLINPSRIVVDDRGFIFVSCFGSSSVVVISPDRQTSRTILGPEQGLHKPFALAVDLCNRKLLVCDRDDGNVFLYQI